MFDLDDLSLPTPKLTQPHGWMCTSCQGISLVQKACACGCKEFIPHLDRRPLLLTKELKNGIITLIDQAADRVPLVEIEEQLHLTGEYMPFLSRLLENASLAEKRRTETGVGYRASAMPTPKILEHFQKMQLPPF